MKRILMITVLSCLCFAISKSQEPAKASSYYSSGIVNQQFLLSSVRDLKGATKIVPEFEGDWTVSQIDAFKFACRIWEEVLPTSFPIRIRAVMDDTYIDEDVCESDQLSDVAVVIRENEAIEGGWPMHFPSTMAKSVVYQKFERTVVPTYWSSVLDLAYFEQPDMEITFYAYKNMDDLYSYSINGSSVNNKYDFATCVMRHIGTGLGLIWTYNKARNGKLYLNENNLTPYEAMIFNSLNNGSIPTDSIRWYQNATQGVLNVGNLSIYAPQTWTPTVSLNYFYPDNTKKLTQLLRWDFKKGMAIRDIYDESVYGMFEDILHWYYQVAVGIGDDQACDVNSVFPETSQILSSGGTLNVSIPTGTRNAGRNENLDVFRQINIRNSTDTLFNLMKKYHPNYYGGSIDNYGWTVAIQKEDGTWDPVYHTDEDSSPFQCNLSALNFHYSMDNYARSYDNHLKCRVTWREDNPFHLNIYSQYFLIKTPPMPIQANSRCCKTVALVDDDEYSKVIKVGLGNLAGINRIVIGQLNDGSIVPFYYEVHDFSDRYFLATVDIEYPTVFTIKGYDSDNNYSIMTFTYNPLLDDDEITLNFTRNGDFINISPQRRNHSSGLAKWYSISKLNVSGNSVKASGRNIVIDDKIDIGTLDAGAYAIHVYDIKGKRHEYKFYK